MLNRYYYRQRHDRRSIRRGDQTPKTRPFQGYKRLANIILNFYFTAIRSPISRRLKKGKRKKCGQSSVRVNSVRNALRNASWKSFSASSRVSKRVSKNCEVLRTPRICSILGSYVSLCEVFSNI